MAKLGCGVNKLQSNLLSGLTADLWQQGLAKSDDALLGAHDSALEHHPVLVNLTEVCETTQWGDALLGKICLCGGAIWVLLHILANAVDLLVDLSPVVVAILTCSWHLELNAGRVPSSDTSDLAQATVSLTRQAAAAPACNDTVVSSTTGRTDDVAHLIL